MGGSGLDHVLDSLRSRLAAYEDTGDPSDIFSDAATADAALLVDAVRDRVSTGLSGRWDDVALAAAGRLHWKRHLTVLPSDSVHDEAAAVLFARPFLRDRSLVPEVLWSHLPGQTPNTPSIDLVEMSAEEIADLAESAVGKEPELAERLVLPLRVAATMLPARHPGRPPVLSALAIVHSLLYRDERGPAVALDAAIEAATAAATSMPDDWSGRAVLLSRMGMFLWERYKRDGGEADLEASETAHRAAVEACAQGDPARPGCLHNLAVTLLSRYELTPEPAILTAAIDTAREAVTTTDPTRAVALLHAVSLASGLRLHFDRTGDPAALAEAEKALTTVLDGAAEDNPYLPLVWSRLGDLPRGRFVRDGKAADREAALAWYRKVLDAVPEGDRLHAAVAAAVAGLSANPPRPDEPRRSRRWRWLSAG
ncbi:hypothetical protein [Nonomuraea dietziae]|uniref:hypothetical protein n=1 Tax=Nonomuraea dietziae TaxID=65515 RepID=UPI0033C25C76